jgi:hypothetical protein
MNITFKDSESKLVNVCSVNTTDTKVIDSVFKNIDSGLPTHIVGDSSGYASNVYSNQTYKKFLFFNELKHLVTFNALNQTFLEKFMRRSKISLCQELVNTKEKDRIERQAKYICDKANDSGIVAVQECSYQLHNCIIGLIKKKLLNVNQFATLAPFKKGNRLLFVFSKKFKTIKCTWDVPNGKGIFSVPFSDNSGKKIKICNVHSGNLHDDRKKISGFSDTSLVPTYLMGDFNAEHLKLKEYLGNQYSRLTDLARNPGKSHINTTGKMVTYDHVFLLK